MKASEASNATSDTTTSTSASSSSGSDSISSGSSSSSGSNNSIRPFTIHVGVSFAGKPQELRAPLKKRRKNGLDFPPESEIAKWRAKSLSRVKGVPTKDAGEDFFFVQEMRNNSGVSFGVADGVGGWVESGIDPSLFSQALMYHAHRYAKHAWVGEPEIDPLQQDEGKANEHASGWELTPYECLELAHNAVLREKTVEAGSSTACLLTVNSMNGLLRAANLGDSGFCIFRSSNLLYYQPPQTHYFNCPKQMSKVPVHSRHYGQTLSDHPRDADIYQTRLRDGDIIVVYTDGLSDNVFANEMMQICSHISRAGGDESLQVQAMADRMVQYARSCMMSITRVSPFEIAAARVGDSFKGGKIDDVTVIVAMIQETI